MPVVYLGIGSNLGDRIQNCLRAVDLIGGFAEVVSSSSMYETEPWGLRDQPKFINMAVKAETDLSPMDLLRALKQVERIMGREESARFGPRLIDLDILFYGGMVVDEPGLKVPHPLIRERGFVLMPLSEIAPDFVHPVLGKTVRELYEGLRRGGAA